MFLINVTRDFSGIYRCKVTLDTPSLISNESSREIIVLQKEHPILKVEKLKYTNGEKLRANCTSPTTHFTNNITWFINDKEITNNRPETFFLPGISFTLIKTFSYLEYNVVSSSQLKVHCSITYSPFRPIQISKYFKINNNDNIEKVIKEYTKDITDVEVVVNSE
ncbi:uncharacterized protein LOC126907802 [Daktulosphaira vitifoliae]|nr:uncharacterized protein LOC126907802 [Daktulosphaira vitifoliae]